MAAKSSRMAPHNVSIQPPTRRYSAPSRVRVPTLSRRDRCALFLRRPWRHFFCAGVTLSSAGISYSTKTNRWSRSQVAKKSDNQPLYPNTR